MKARFLLFQTIIFITVFCAVAMASRVTLDRTFNATGYRLQQIVSSGSFAESLAIQSDGRIVLGGWTYTNSGPSDFASIRLNTNGALDTGYDLDGILTSNLGPFDRADVVKIQPDGKILIAGERYAGDTNDDFAIVRYNTDGTLDNTFDGNGVAATNVNGFSDEHCYDMALQPDGKIVLVGTTAADDAANTQILLVRYNTDGSLDTTFGGTGKVILLGPPDFIFRANAVVIQNDGNIIVGGYYIVNGNRFYLIKRFTSGGVLDNSYQNSGSVAVSNNTILSLAFQSSGKLVVHLGSGSGSVFIRLNHDSSPDTNSFGATGIATAPISARSMIIQPDDKILLGGAQGGHAAISRLTSNGKIDNSFDIDGVAVTPIPAQTCSGQSIALQTDRKIVLGGNCSSGVNQFAVFRFQEIGSPVFDFDGDGKTDISIFRPSLGEWWYQRSSDGGNYAAQFGASSDKLTPADFTGDGKTDIALFRPSTGEWFVLRSEDASFYSFPFGANGDIPAPGDFDADGRADSAVFRPSDSTWYIRRSTDGGATIQQFGQTGDVPVAADYDGDGKADIAVYRTASSEWWINRSTSGLIAFQFGNSSDKPVQGDYTGDGKADVALFRPVSGEWFVLRSENQSFYSFPFGVSTDIPAPGDFDGDGKFDATVFRSSNATWFVNKSTGGNLIQSFGQTGDAPVPNAFVP